MGAHDSLNVYESSFSPHLGTRIGTHGWCWQVAHGIRRVNVGGKLLTNYLKEVISYRAWNMMDETYLVNEVSNLSSSGAACYDAMTYGMCACK
jgi:hypothetical protein